jgi:LysM repeat protein
VAFGLSCRIHNTTATDTWQSIATKNKVLVNELIRSNPQVKGRITRGATVFIPPCNQGQKQKPPPKRNTPKSAKYFNPATETVEILSTLDADTSAANAAGGN